MANPNTAETGASCIPWNLFMESYRVGFMVMIDETGMVSAVSIQEKNRGKQRIRFATMSNEKRPKGMPKKEKHTIILPDKVWIRFNYLH